MLRSWNIGRLLILVLAFWSLSVHAVEGQEDAKVTLEQRIAKYWEARQSRDVRTVYEMESGNSSLPGGWLKVENAMAVAGLPVRNVKIEQVTIEGERAKVRVNGTVMVGTLGWVPQTLEDTWVLINGQWYHETRRQ